MIRMTHQLVVMVLPVEDRQLIRIVGCRLEIMMFLGVIVIELLQISVFINCFLSLNSQFLIYIVYLYHIQFVLIRSFFLIT